MSFLYPLFLIAGAALAIPILIHLFNLRRYKTVLFPHTRFLKNIQLKSQKQSQVRYKWLLALRLLFLASLVLAFAQPFFNRNDQKNAGKSLQVIYIDNSASMSVKKGARSLLDIAKDAARKQVKKALPGSKSILLTNGKPVSYRPLPADRILTEINAVDISAVEKTVVQTFVTVQSLMQSEAAEHADVYYYSDFQRNSFAAQHDKELLKNIDFYGVPVQADAAQNIYVDTAYLASPVLQTGQNNQLIVTTRSVGKLPVEAPVLQLVINDQVKSAASLNFNEKNESTDTLGFQVNDANWQRMMLTVNDASVRFDDTFRITARSAPNLSVLVLNEGQANPYIQAAFRAYNGFRLNQASIGTTADWKEYNLVILNGITRIDETLANALSVAMQQGRSVCIFPGRTNSFAAINDGLKKVADIRITGIDTASQAAATLQQGSSLVRDLFERIPGNVQLPVANWHYVISAGLDANQQSVLSFRSGAPFLAQYTPARGKLYISATSANLEAGNFTSSYFFVPFLYQMAMQSRGGDVYAITAGQQQAAYMPLINADERNMVHVYAPGIDAIPPQRPAGSGLDVFIDQAVQAPGFYTLASRGTDSAVVALNGSRAESQLETWKINALKNEWEGDHIKWLTASEAGNIDATANLSGFPLWKVCVILALLMLAAETYLLAGGFRKQNVATQ